MVLKTMHTYRVALATLLACLLVLMMTGCAGNPQFTDYHAFVQEPRMPASSEPYMVGPPDVLEFRSERVSEVHNYREVVSPDGFVNVPLLGRIFVAGRTVESIQQELEQRATFYYQDAEVNVRVSRYASKRFFVFGQVATPGSYIYNGSNSILETLAAARPTALADPSSILIVRPDAEGQLRARMTIDLDHMITTGDTTLDSVLHEGDIIYVPPNQLARVGLTFQQLLFPIRPIADTVQGPANIVQSATGQLPYGD